MEKIEVDLVCCWVSLNENYYENLKAYKEYANEKNSFNKGRFRELGELNYSIPAAIKNLPWIRKVFIVTNGQQIPEKISALPNVEVVHHPDFFRDPTDLPTFSYHSIEANLCFIKGLSEHFIITNDDFFITKPMPKSEFLGKNSLGVFIHTSDPLNGITNPENVWRANLQATDNALSKRYGDSQRKIFPHSPQLVIKSKCIEMWEVFEQELKSVSSQKFRAISNVIFRALYSYYVMYHNWGIENYDDLIKLSDGDVRYFTKNEFTHISLGLIGKGNWQKKLEKVIEDPPQFFCLNDDIPEKAYEHSAEAVNIYLKQIFAN